MIAFLTMLIPAVTATGTTTSSVSCNFNGTSIAAGNKIWFTAVVKVTGTATYPLTIYFTGQTITSSAFSLSVPNAILVLDPATTTATTVYNGTTWVTTARPDESGYYFLSGYTHTPTTTLAGGLSPVTWAGTLTTSRTGVSLEWHMAAAVYTTFNTNFNSLGVKPSKCTSCSSYANSDDPGTPESYKTYVIGGARGGGGSNYTGGYSEGGHLSSCSTSSCHSTAICAGTTTTLTPVGGGGSWTSSNTSVATVSAGVVTGVAAGTARISYITSGCPLWQWTTVTVDAAPSVTATAAPTSLCAGGTLSLTATTTSSGGGIGSGGSGYHEGHDDDGSGGGCHGGSSTTFAWHGPSSFTSSSATPMRVGVTSAMGGVYSVTVTDRNGCSTTATTAAVTVRQLPTSITATVSPIPICAGTTIHLNGTVTGGSGYTLLWTGGTSTISSATTASATIGSAAVTDAGTYSLTATAAGCAGSTRGTATLPLVHKLPTTLTASVNPATVCAGDQVALRATSYGSAGTVNYVWTGPTGGSTIVNPTSITTASITSTVLNNAGVYTLTASAEACGTMTALTGALAVNKLPSLTAVVNPTNVCAGGTFSLTGTATGGSGYTLLWTGGTSTINNNTTTNANVTSAVTADAGSYTLTATSLTCGTVSANTNATPLTVTSAPISSGATNNGPVCAGGTATLTAHSSNATAWSWTGPGGFSSTLQNPTVAPTATSTYSLTLSNPGSGCSSSAVYTTTVAINSLPNAGTITGATSVCTGATTTMSSSVTGGVWSTGAAGVASVNSAGVVTGISSGTATISYTVTNGCGSSVATATITVGASANAGTISGAASVCTGATTTLTDAISGGVWSSSATGKATVSTAGVVTGVSAGTVTISYTVTGGCGTATATKAMTVNAAPGAGTITGASTVCAGAMTALSNATSGGAWSSGAAGVATVNSSGVVTGVSAGAATISYAVTNSCGTSVATSSMTVGAAPDAGTVTGGGTICQGATTSLSDGVSGGAWTSSAPGVATVNSAGVVTGVSVGSAAIAYTVTNSCGSSAATASITVSPLPDAGTIAGVTTVCAGSSVSLNDCAAGGVWSSGATGTATVGATGVVTGVSAGVTTISYTVTNSCGTATATAGITVSPMPDAGTITGGTNVCAGSSTTLNDGVSGGVWTSGAAGTATVNSGGAVTGVAAGVATISYTVTNSCGTASSTTSIVVNALPDAGTISGSSTICAGSTTTLGNCAAGGAWSSSATSVATVSSGGVVTAVSAGASTISYTVTNSCGTATATKAISVNAMSASLTGPGSVDVGTTIPLVVSGGSWSSSDMSVATVDASGIVTGVNGGSATISYSFSNGCFSFVTTKVITVNNVTIAPITGVLHACVGNTTTLADVTAGGTWASDNTAVATVSSAGLVTGISAGTATISYSAAGSVVMAIVTIDMLPAPISGLGLCAGMTSTLTDAVGGGTWGISSTTIATINSSTGVVTAGTTTGTALVTYTLSTGCVITGVLSVNANPASITGTTTVCAGGTTTLADATGGGTWSSSDGATAAVGTTGVVTGISAGTATISYTLGTGCYATATVSVNAAPSTITGSLIVCQGSTSTLGNTVSGGTWSSSNTGVAAIDVNTGVVTGVTGGTARITYTTAAGCFTSVVATVNAIQPITGITTICLGNTSTLSDATTGGTWSSSNATVASVGATTGVVTGASIGAATITYTLSNGCTRTASVNVSIMTPISGSLQVCVGLTTALSNSTPGGTWSSSLTAVATVGTSGIANGLVAGTTTISYSVGSCRATAVLSVIASPAVITGPTSVCEGATINLSDVTTGGTWSTTSSNITISGTATTTLAVTGITPGVATVSYTAGGAGCYRLYTLSVNPLPSAVTGTFTVCPGGTTTLSDATTGGTWASANTSIAVVVVNSGVVTGINSGTVAITYRSAAGCNAIATVTVIASPSAISGPLNVCTGSTVTLSDSSGSGTWNSSNTGQATVGATTGIVTGITAGTPFITFTLASTGCKTKVTVTVTAIPNAGTLSGPSVVPVGGTITIVSSGTPGGTWSSSDASLATVGTSGIVNGVAAGSATITYSIGNACGFSGAYKPISIAAGRGTGGTPGRGYTLQTGGESITADGVAGGNSAPAVQPGVSSTNDLLTVGNRAEQTVPVRTHNVAGSQRSMRMVNANGVSATAANQVRVIPNPNKGTFTVTGALNSQNDEVADLEIRGLLGQVVYKGKILVKNGAINQQVSLDRNLANGMYMLSVKSSTEQKVFHFVMEQ